MLCVINETIQGAALKRFNPFLQERRRTSKEAGTRIMNGI